MSHRLLFTLVLFLTVANILVWSWLGLEKAYAERAYPGIWVQAQPLSGLTRDQIIDRLKPINDAMVLKKVTLVLDNKEYQATLAELGYQVNTENMAQAALSLGRGQTWKESIISLVDYYRERNIPLQYDVNEEQLNRYLEEIGQNVMRPPQNMGLAYRDGLVTRIPPANGLLIDKEELRSAIQKTVRPGKEARIIVSFQSTEPLLKTEAQIVEAEEQLKKLVAQPLKLQAEGFDEQLDPETIYSFVAFDTKDSKLVIVFDEDKVQTAIAKLAKKVDSQPVARRVSTVNNEVLDEGKDGKRLDAPNTAGQIMDRLKSADFSTPITLKVDTLDRKVVTVSPEYQLGLYPGRYIMVDLSAQRMHLVEGTTYHKTFIVSTGKWDMPTPTGEMQIHNHIKTAWSKRYGLYMDHWMAITSNGEYGIHQLPRWPGGKVEGTNHLGRPVSHGCIRLGPGDAEYVYNWAANGTKVIIQT